MKAGQIKQTSHGAVLALMVCGLAGDAKAQSGDWQYEITPYIWGASISGHVAAVPGLPTAEIDASFSDIVENLDFGALVFGSATNGRFGLFGDLQYFSVSASASGSGGLATGIVESDIFVMTFGGEYVAVDTDTTNVRLMAGVRRWDVETDIALTIGPVTTLASGQNNWWDGLVGVRARRDLGERGYLTGVALAGAGGSEFTVDLFAGYGHRVSETTSFVVGYRYLNVDREDGDFVYDVEQGGILLGVRFTI